MIESPLVQQWKAESLHEAILAVLKERFGAVPRDVTKALRCLHKEKKLIKLTVLASQCHDIEGFRVHCLLEGRELSARYSCLWRKYK